MNSTTGEGLEVSQGGACGQAIRLESRVWGTFTKTVITCGQGFTKPNLESVCKISLELIVLDSDSTEALTSRSDGKVFKQSADVTIGSSESDLFRMVEVCLMTMSTGEVSQFSCNLPILELSKHISSDKNSDSVESVQDMTCGDQVSICITLTLHSFSVSPPTWKLNSDEKYKLALFHKTEANQLFQGGKVKAAFHRYSTAVRYLICIPEISAVAHPVAEVTDSIEEFRKLEYLCYLNLAACQAKTGHHQGVVENCTRALALDGGSVKGLYRRAVAYIALGKSDAARNDLVKARKLDPKSKAVASLLDSCNLKQ